MTKQQTRAYMKAWRKRNAKKLKAYRITAKGKGLMKAYAKIYYKKNAKRLRVYQRAYRTTPKWKATRAAPSSRAGRLATMARFHARRHGAPGSFTGEQFLVLCAKYNNRCVCCGKRGRLGPDHVTPLSRGGSNFISNIQPLLLRCNLRKGSSLQTSERDQNEQRHS